MAENTQQQFRNVLANQEDRDKAKVFDYNSLRIDEQVTAADLDKRFFSGATEQPDALKEAINNATGYRSFTSYYDLYTEQQGPNRTPMSKERFASAIEGGQVESLKYLIGKDGRVDPSVLDTSPLQKFGEGVSYDDKLRAMVRGQARELSGKDGNNIGFLPIDRMLKNYDAPKVEQSSVSKLLGFDQENKLRMPTLSYNITPKANLIKDDNSVEKVVGKDEVRTLFKEGDGSGKGAVILDMNEKVVSFKGMLDNYTTLNQYQKLSILKSQASGEFNQVRTLGQIGKDTIAGVGNLALWAYESVGNTIIDTYNDIKGSEFDEFGTQLVQQTGRIEDRHINYAAETFHKNTGVKQSNADLIFRWSPDITETALKELVAGLVISGPFQAIKVGSYFVRNANFRKFVVKTYGKDGKGTFDDAYLNAIKKNKRPDVLIKEHVEASGNLINSQAYRNWKANGVMSAVARTSEYKRIFKGSKSALEDMDIVDSRIAMLKRKLSVLDERKSVDEKWQKAFNNVSNELEDQYSYKNSLFIRNLLPQDLREALTTEAAISFGMALMRTTQQSYFPESSEAMFDIGGVVLGNYAHDGLARKTYGALDGALRGSRSGSSLVGAVVGVYKSLFNTDSQQKADYFVRTLKAGSPEMLVKMEAGILRAEEITTNILEMRGADGLPLITEPDVIVNTLAHISAIDILRAKSQQIGNKLSVGGMAEINGQFVRLQENISSQSELNTQLAVALQELQRVRFAKGVDPSVKQFADGLEKYLRNSRQVVKEQIAHFSNDIDTTRSFLLMEASGVNINGKQNAYTNHEAILQSLTSTEEELMRSLGASEKEIIEKANASIEEFKVAVLEGAAKSNIVTTTLPKEIGDNMSSGFAAHKTAEFKNASKPYAILREKYKDASMDISPIYDAIVDGIEDSVLVGGNAAKNIAGTRLPNIIEGKLSQVFNKAATDLFASDPRYGKLRDTVLEIYPDASDIQVWTVLKKGTEDFEGLSNIKLPINFQDFQLVASGLSASAYKYGASRQALPTKEIKRLLFDVAEDETTGFKVGLLQPDGGTPVGVEVMEELKIANGGWQDTNARYESGIGKTWSSYQRTKLSNGQIKYNVDGQDPQNWLSNAQKDFNEKTGNGLNKFNNGKDFELFTSEMASVYGGKLVQRPADSVGTEFATPARYEFIKGQAGTETFKAQWLNEMKYQMVTNTQSGRNMLKLHKDPKLNKQFLTQDDMVKDRIILDYKDEDVMNLLNNMKSAKVRNPETGELENMFDDIDIQDVFDSVGIEALALKSNMAKQAIKNVKNEIEQIQNTIKLRKTDEAKEVQAQIELGQNYGKDLTPDFVYGEMLKGDKGLANLDKTREAYENSLRGDPKLDDATRKLKINQYDRFVASQFTEGLLKNSISPVTGNSRTTLNIDMTKATIIDTGNMKIDPKKLLTGLGKGSSQNPATIKDLLTRGADGVLDSTGKQIDGDQFYKDITSIAELTSGKEPSTISGITLTGIPTGLSIESYISRIYSVARGVVSLKYLMTEAVLQTARVQKFNAFTAMINSPEIAELVAKAVRSGKPLRGDDAIKFDQLLLSAVAKQGVMYASSPEVLSPEPKLAAGQYEDLFVKDETFGPNLSPRAIEQGYVRGGGDTVMKMEKGDIPIMNPVSGKFRGKYNVQPAVDAIEGFPKAVGDFRDQMGELNFQRQGGERPANPNSNQINNT